MRVLVACEYSGVVRDAFRAKGHLAYSCDTQPVFESEGKTHRFHFCCDVRDLLGEKWDLVVAHPPCTYLTVTGNRWFLPKYKDRFPNREQQRKDAIKFFELFTNLDWVDKVCIENPVGIMSRIYQKPQQIIQPFQFGHKEAKKTCLWLKGLPPLKHTKIVEPEYTTYKSGKRMATWYADALKLPKEERTNLRSKTFQGIADAMAEQWGSLGVDV